MADPLGSKLLDAWAANDPDVIKNVKEQIKVDIEMKKVAAQYPEKIDLQSPSLKRQQWLIEEAARKREMDIILGYGTNETSQVSLISRAPGQQ